MLKAILIDPFTKTVTDYSVERDFRAIYAAIGRDCFDCVMLPDNHAMYVDDEGLYRKDQAFFELGGKGPFAGKALILGNDREGDSIDCSITTGTILKNIVWRPHIEVTGWTEQKETELPGGFHIQAPMPKFTPKK